MRRLACLRAILFLAAAAAWAGCSTSQPAAPPALPVSSGSSIVGIASWYGPGFDGHRTSSGVVYDQEGMTAASTLFPLGTRLRVTNLENRRSVEVAVNDHGPYVKGRAIDLSHQAANRLGMIGPGTAPVRMDILYTPPGGPALGQRYFVQVGSFTDPANAQALDERLATRYPEVRVTAIGAAGDRRYRVRLGAFTDLRTAEDRAFGLRRMGYRTKIVTE